MSGTYTVPAEESAVGGAGRSDGHQVATGDPYLEARTGAADRDAFLEQLWDALTPEYRVAAAAFVPGRLAEAAMRHARPASGPGSASGDDDA